MINNHLQYFQDNKREEFFNFF